MYTTRKRSLRARTRIQDTLSSRALGLAAERAREQRYLTCNARTCTYARSMSALNARASGNLQVH